MAPSLFVKRGRINAKLTTIQKAIDDGSTAGKSLKDCLKQLEKLQQCKADFSVLMTEFEAAEEVEEEIYIAEDEFNAKYDDVEEKLDHIIEEKQDAAATKARREHVLNILGMAETFIDEKIVEFPKCIAAQIPTQKWLEEFLEAVIRDDTDFRAAIAEGKNIFEGEELESLLARQTVFSEKTHKLNFELLQKLDAFRERPSAHTSSKSPQRKQNVRLPKLEMKTFDGSYGNWIGFRDSFLVNVHERSDIDELLKFQYLQGAVRLPNGGKSVVDSYTLSKANYALAWEALNRRYNDVGKIAASHHREMENCLPMRSRKATELRRVLDVFECNLSALKQSGRDVIPENGSHEVVIRRVTSLLDEVTLLKWKEENEDDSNMKWSHLEKFLERQWRLLESMEDVMADRNAGISPKVEVKKCPKTSQVHVGQSRRAIKCFFCDASHYVTHCPLSLSDRWKAVKEKNLCVNCLRDGHQVASCPVDKRCQKCQKNHHTSLHRDFENGNSFTPPNNVLRPNASIFKPPNVTNAVLTDSESSQNSDRNGWYQIPAQASTSVTQNHSSQAGVNADCAFLSTVIVLVQDVKGEWQRGRALWDTGSQKNLMSEKFASRLGLTLQDDPLVLNGVNGGKSLSKHSIESSLASENWKFIRPSKFHIVPRPTGIIPAQTVDVSRIKFPENCKLADPRFNEAREVDMIVNNAVCGEAQRYGKKRIFPGITLSNTAFGWIVSGAITPDVPESSSALLQAFSFHVQTGNDSLDEKLDLFFRADDVPEPTKRSWSSEEKHCEEYFVRTTSKAADGKFVVSMPMKEGFEKLGSNFKKAQQQSFAQENRRKKNKELNDLYVSSMEDFIDSQHMSLAPTESDAKIHYLPHHPVIKMSSTSTKLRPVFNAACKSETGISLNDVLCVGPTIQPESYDTMLRFRETKFVVMADLKQMYRQIWIEPSQRNLLRVLWRSDFESPLKTYTINTVTFGTSCAPFIAIRCLKEMANECRKELPAVADALENSFYVDDFAKGFDSVEEAQTLLTQLKYVCSCSGFQLTKIAANNEELMKFVPATDQQPLSEELSITKVLGIPYDVTNDIFSFKIKPIRAGESTKTTCLSEVMAIYDLLGFITPLKMKFLLFLKKLWKLKLDWKEVFSPELQQEWDELRMNLQALNNVKIPRQIYIENHIRIDVHGFCDASEKGYGAVLYAVSEDANEARQVSLITSKARVAPNAIQSLPRLELCSALLLSQLGTRVLAILKKPIRSMTFWSDSTISIHWIGTGDLSKLSTYVANRVSKIQSVAEKIPWRHIEGRLNPADSVSRGLLPEEIIESTFLRGPEFLQLPEEEWPNSKLTTSSDDPEVLKELKKKNVEVNITRVHQQDNFITNVVAKFSSSLKMKRTIAYVLRFLRKKLPRYDPEVPREGGNLTEKELEKAEKVIVRAIQREEFPKEHQLLSRDLQIPKQSRLHRLSPIMQRDGIIRVLGRLGNNHSLPFNKRHPMILPPGHFSKVVTREIHRKNDHVGQKTLKAMLREKFWIISSNSVISRVVHECLECFRASPNKIKQMMADLPESRIMPSPAFQKVAVDYAGYFLIKSGTTRTAPATKSYLAMFKCMSTGAVHLELASDLTTKEFINVLTRFSARRGCPTQIFSDNATCFEGCNNELRNIIRNNERTAENQHEGIKWNFTTPRAPHAGGYYEAGIKSVKFHLKRVIGDKLHTFEQFSTILCRIEAIVNSRPLTSVTEDPTDLDVLTPSHFLIHRPMTSLPERRFLPERTSRLNKWEQVQQAQQQFWSQWHREYLHTLQKRPRDCIEPREFRIGDMVLVHDSNTPTMKWVIGRITRMFPGKDGVVRKVEVITKMGAKTRHVNYLSLLPFNSDSLPGGQDVACAIFEESRRGDEEYFGES